MSAIILEVLLFLALIGVVGAMSYLVVLYFTPVGRRIRETRNRLAIDSESDRTCPAHGTIPDGELVRLPSGERICPFCYREAAQGMIE